MKGKTLTKNLRVQPHDEMLDKTVKLLKISSEGNHFYRFETYWWLTVEAGEWNLKNIAQRSYSDKCFG